MGLGLSSTLNLSKQSLWDIQLLTLEVQLFPPIINGRYWVRSGQSRLGMTVTHKWSSSLISTCFG